LQKEQQVLNIFDSIAKKYDVMNSLMSFGIHKFWQKIAIKKANVPVGGKVLDVCCGTGMITMDLARKAGPEGIVIGIDFSNNMLNIAKTHLEHFKFKKTIELIHANALAIPFPDNTFDCATIGYGLRNIADPKKVLTEIKRVVKPGGRVVSLEMAKPYLKVFKQIYYVYLNNWVPFLGRVFGHNNNAYRYLHDSIVSFIHQNEVTKIYEELEFKNIQCSQLTWGIVAVHVGTKSF
jgi:demethylmenaquinone methyltransferase / 2-methoxy-6-polyprenyl-1,4-benzoquinol methylase